MNGMRATKVSGRCLRAIVASAVMLGTEQTIGDERTFSGAMEIARINGLGFEFASRISPQGAFMREELQRVERFERAMRDSSAILQAQGIDHIFFKCRKYYRYYDSNLDVIVRVTQWKQAVIALEGRGYAGHVMFKEPDKLMFTRSGAAISIHLHPGVTWNGVPYFDPVTLWENSTPSDVGAARELAPDDEFAVNLAHGLFENYAYSLGDALYFERFLSRRTPDVDRLRHQAALNGWEAGFGHAYKEASRLACHWSEAERRRRVPAELLDYPYRIPIAALAGCWARRIAWNTGRGHIKTALRESYAYPAFYLLDQRHDLKGLIG